MAVALYCDGILSGGHYDPPDPGADQAWLEEIQRRSREFDAGLVEGIPAEKVFADLRAKLSLR